MLFAILQGNFAWTLINEIIYFQLYFFKINPTHFYWLYILLFLLNYNWNLLYIFLLKLCIYSVAFVIIYIKIFIFLPILIFSYFFMFYEGVFRSKFSMVKIFSGVLNICSSHVLYWFLFWVPESNASWKYCNQISWKNHKLHKIFQNSVA